MDLSHAHRMLAGDSRFERDCPGQIVLREE